MLGINVEESRLLGGEGLKELSSVKEKIDIAMNINGMKIVFTVDDYEEILKEKIKRHIKNNLCLVEGKFKDKQIRDDLNNFLKALIREEKKFSYNAPALQGILNIESDYTFAKWFCNNLDEMWS